MEGKHLIYVLLLIALMGVGYGIYHTTEIDDANKELIAVTEQISSLESLIQKQKVYIEVRGEAVAQLTALNIMQKDAAALRKEILDLRVGEEQARRDFEQAIENSRNNAAGLVLNDPILPNGIRLRNARVEKVDKDVTTISHSEGISKFTPDMLPLELKERFRFGMPIGGPTETVASSTATSSVPTTTVSSLPVAASKTDLLSAAQKQLERLKKELPYLEEELKKTETESAAATSPSKKFYFKNRLDSINKQIADLKGQMLLAENEVKKHE